MGWNSFFLHARGKKVPELGRGVSVVVALFPDVFLNKPKLVSSFHCVCSSREHTPVQRIIILGKLYCCNLNSCCTALMVALILCRGRSLFSALYQFFMCSHLSLGDGCHPAAGCHVFTCPPGADISWTLTDEEGKTWLYLLFTNLA